MSREIKRVKPLWLGIAIFCLSACNSRQDVVGYSEKSDNGLRKEILVGKSKYTIQYKSPGYIVEREHLPAEQKAARLKQLEGMVWLNIALSVEGFNQSPLRYEVSGMEEYTARQDYYLNGAPKDMYALYGKDTLYVNSYWFENNQNLLPYETLVAGFKLPEGIDIPDEDITFSFYDRIFRNGIIKAVFDKENIQDIPK